MTPITEDIPGVPEPPSLALLASGLLRFGLIRWRVISRAASGAEGFVTSCRGCQPPVSPRDNRGLH